MSDTVWDHLMRAPYNGKMYFIDYQDVSIPDRKRWRLVKRWIQGPAANEAYGFKTDVPDYDEPTMNSIDDWPPLPHS